MERLRVSPAHNTLQNGCKGSDADSSADKHCMLRCKDLSSRGAKRSVHITLTNKGINECIQFLSDNHFQ